MIDKLNIGPVKSLKLEDWLKQFRKAVSDIKSGHSQVMILTAPKSE